MTSIKYDEVYSRFYSKVQAYDFLDLTDEQLDEFLCNWVHSQVSKPYIRRLFTTVLFDDELSEFTYDMKYIIDEDSDKEFILEVLSIGMIVEWLSPKINSITNVVQMFGSKEEKFYSQSNHLSELRKLKDDAKKEQRSIIADRGYAWNTYLDGE